MSYMAVNYARVSNPKWIREHIEIVRYVDSFGPAGGSAQCVDCGLSPLTQRELANIIGVPLSAFSAFLNRGAGRPDVIRKIERSVLRIRRFDRTEEVHHGQSPTAPPSAGSERVEAMEGRGR